MIDTDSIIVGIKKNGRGGFQMYSLEIKCLHNWTLYMNLCFVSECKNKHTNIIPFSASAWEEWRCTQGGRRRQRWCTQSPSTRWLWGPQPTHRVDCGDIYIMMQCLSVTKNEHFLKRSVCLFVMFYPHFFKIRN